MRKRVGWLIGTVLAGWGCSTRTADSMGDAVLRASFVNRALISHGKSGSKDELYDRFVERSLLIRATKVVDNSEFQHDPDHPEIAAGSWTFPRLIARALSGVGYAGTAEVAVPKICDLFLSSNFAKRWKDADADRRLGTIPLRLLAVVNRFDLARGDSRDCPLNRLCGAEFRFVYAGIKETEGDKLYLQNPYFTLILEFVLPPMEVVELRKLDGQWIALRDKDDPNAHLTGLEKALVTTFETWGKEPHPTARIRVNSRSGDAGPWTFGQFLITDTGFQMVPLDQQFPTYTSTCVKPGSALGRFLDDSDNQKSVMRDDYNFFTPPGKCPDGTSIDECAATVNTGDVTVLTLGTGVAPGAKNLDELRYKLSVNSCTGCHGQETQGNGKDPTDTLDEFTHFDQIKYREPKTESRLSRFLAGKQGGEIAGPGSPGWTINPPVVPKCGPAAAPRTFNDLLRRVQYHAMLAKDLPAGVTIRAVNKLAARQAH